MAAAAFLAAHGIDLQAEMSRVQFGSAPLPLKKSSPSSPPPADSSPSSLPLPPLQPLTLIRSVLLPDRSTTEHHDIYISPTTGRITAIVPSPLSPSTTPSTHLPSPIESIPLNPTPPNSIITCTSCPALPSLTHPHIHLDKPHLLSHPRYAHLQPRTGSFAEALSLTAKAKELFQEDDLLQRANWLVRESVEAGVTHMRAFVEVDTSVGLRGVAMGQRVRDLWQGRCEIQIVAFAQEPLFGDPEHEDDNDDATPPAPTNRSLLASAALLPSIPVLGSTPYVEASPALARRNIDWLIDLTIAHRKHLDLHLDYTLDPAAPPLVFHALAQLTHRAWLTANPGRTICLGHCTRLTLFGPADWRRLRAAIGALPVYFVGLPSSDLFMMGRPVGEEEGHVDRMRGTLPVPWMVSQGLKACVGVNNVGNAFTPFGGADPLGVASWGVGVYQVGTAEGARVLYEAVSGRGREACGMGGGGEAGRRERGREAGEEGDGRGTEEQGDDGGGGVRGHGWGLRVGEPADLVIYGKPLERRTSLDRPRRSVQEIVYDAGRERVVVKAGRVVRVD